MGITTKKGDGGQTSLLSGDWVDKDSVRMELLGDMDELSCALGMVRSRVRMSELGREVLEIQSALADMCGIVANMRADEDSCVEMLPAAIARIEDRVGGLEREVDLGDKFILPGESAVSAELHRARAVARRCERRAVSLGKQEPIPAGVQVWLNRLSDYLWMLARKAEDTHGD